MLGLFALVGVCLWAWETPVLLPAKLLAVMTHETGHAIATWLVGGTVEKVSIALNESGACMSRRPESFFAAVLVSSGGYVGNALISALLLILTLRARVGRPILIVFAAWLLLFGLLFARDLFTFAFCLVTGAVFGLLARFLPRDLTPMVTVFVATFNALYAILDVKDDLWTASVRARSDAQILADITYVPALVWAVLWSGLSVALLVFATWTALKPRSAQVRGLPRVARNASSVL